MGVVGEAVKTFGGELDADWFDDFVHRETPSLVRLAFLIVRDESKARDAVQEAWLAAWRSRRSLRRVDDADRWVRRILINSCRMAMRHQRRHPVVPLIEATEREDPLAPESIAIERDALTRVFATLGADDRALLALYYVYDRPILEIGDALGIPEGTVKSRLHRLRTALGVALREQHDQG